jgi:hypothetical protein
MSVHKGLPLAPLPFGGTYQRLHFTDPSSEQAEKNLRGALTSELPKGNVRRVRSYVDHPDHGTHLCGFAEREENRWVMFTESIDQIVIDVLGGYPYEFNGGDGPVAFTAQGGELLVAGAPYRSAGLVDETGKEPETYVIHLVSTDAHEYRKQRHATG